MKYFILSTFEMDGHSSASQMICENLTAQKLYLQSLLYDEENEKYYPTSSRDTLEDGTELIRGTWDCGEWAVMIIPFKTYKSIVNKEFFTMTG